jgi:hypothetical protein
MQALLEVKKGEHPYKAAVSQWFRDEDGPLCFRMISKKRKNGQIEMVCYTLRKDGLKRVIQHISFAEKDFYDIISLLEKSLKQFFPEIELNPENVDVSNQSNCQVEKASRWGVLKLKTINQLECKIHALKTRFYKQD